MTLLPNWMRGALLATAVVNIVGSIAFLPAAEALRELGGMPNGEHPLYVATVGLFILCFGFGYLYAGLTGRPERLFIAVAAAGKLLFFALLAFYWLQGAVPSKLLFAASGDLVFGSIFVYWLVGSTPSHAQAGI